jgi:hypothetical protein
MSEQTYTEKEVREREREAFLAGSRWAFRYYQDRGIHPFLRETLDEAKGCYPITLANPYEEVAE